MQQHLCYLHGNTITSAESMPESSWKYFSLNKKWNAKFAEYKCTTMIAKICVERVSVRLGAYIDPIGMVGDCRIKPACKLNIISVYQQLLVYLFLNLFTWPTDSELERKEEKKNSNYFQDNCLKKYRKKKNFARLIFFFHKCSPKLCVRIANESKCIRKILRVHSRIAVVRSSCKGKKEKIEQKILVSLEFVRKSSNFIDNLTWSS